MTLLDEFKAIVGPRGYLDDHDDLAAHVTEWRGLYRGNTPLVLKPATTAEVAAICKLAHETKTPLAIQGGNTGLVGGGIPDESGEEILVSLSRMKKIRVIDAHDFSMTAEAGMTVAELQKAADDVDRLFPLSLASEGSCTLGGVISTNAGGINVLRYGTMRDLVLGLEVVLATGETWHGLRTLRKDNTGYDLKQFFIGAEGTLGIVTAATVKLYPAIRARATALFAVPSAEAAVQLLGLSRGMSGDRLTAFELISRVGLDLVLRHIPGTRDPLNAPSPWYVLLEISSPNTGEPLADVLDRVIASGMKDNLITDGVVAQSEDQAASLWRLRESLSEAQKHEGGSIKHDVSVPISRIPEFLDRAIPCAAQIVKGARPVPFGHLGDGNLHFNVQAPIGQDKKTFEAHWTEMNRAIHDIVIELGGSISAEHGIGRLKREELAHYRPGLDLDLMRKIKKSLDPHHILNRGRILE